MKIIIIPSMAKERLEPKFPRWDRDVYTLSQARTILGGRLPSVFEKYDFPEPGIILTETGPKVTIYPANQEGFNFLGKFALKNYLFPNLEALGDIFILDPFALCGEFLTKEHFDMNQQVWEYKARWYHFNTVVVPTVNYGLALPRTGVVVALCEGAQVNDGMSSEMPYTSDRRIPVVGIRSDLRLNENIATGTNPAVRYFASKINGGSYHENPIDDFAYQAAFKDIKKLVEARLQKWERNQKQLKK